MNISKSLKLIQLRQISYKQVKSWYAGLVKPKPQNPPYNHIIQIGDPTLRTISDPVLVEFVGSPEVQFLLKKLKIVFKKYNCVGLSSTQIGIPLRIFILEFNKKHAKLFTSQEFKIKEMSLLPETVVINPQIKILDYTKIIFPEACESVKGFYADVARYRSVELQGLDENGNPISLEAVGWLARIIQHEIDHLNGVVYTDIMDRKSFTCSCWSAVNQHGGKIELPYG